MGFLGNTDLFAQLKKSIYLITAIGLILWLLTVIKDLVIIFIASFIFVVIFNPLVTKLEEKGISRVLGTLFIIISVLFFIGISLWVIIPGLIEQFSKFASDFPKYTISLLNFLFGWLESYYPNIKTELELNIKNIKIEQILLAVQPIISKFGTYSSSLINFFVFVVTFLGIFIYSLINPRGLIKVYLYLFPMNLRDKAVEAFIKGSKLSMGWIWSSYILGIIEGISSIIFLSLIGLPLAIFFGIIAFFSQFIPRIGPYFVVIPTMIMAFSVDPIKALWILIFYFILNEITGNFIEPYIRSSQMNLDPVFIIFMVLSMSYLFGFIGTLISTPVACFLKAFYDEFYLSRQPKDLKINRRVEQVIKQTNL